MCACSLAVAAVPTLVPLAVACMRWSSTSRLRGLRIASSRGGSRSLRVRSGAVGALWSLLLVRCSAKERVLRGSSQRLFEGCTGRLMSARSVRGQDMHGEVCSLTLGETARVGVHTALGQSLQPQPVLRLALRLEHQTPRPQLQREGLPVLP